MARITCYHCFRTFDARQLHFKCVMHPEGPHLFAWQPRFWERQPPRYALCPRDELLTGFRACPFSDCHQDLPYYAGRSEQRVVAVTGCSGTGKTLYLWSLVHQLSHEAAREGDPYAALLFENDDSYQTFETLNSRLLVDRQVPDPTQGEEMRAGLTRPLIVRVLRGGKGGSGLCNLVFYDPAGELFENLEEAQYLRYLAGSAAIVYLVDLPQNLSPGEADRHRRKTSTGLNAVIHQVRRELGLTKEERLNKPLAVALTKCDATVFDGHDRRDWVAGHGQGARFWRRWSGSARREVEAVSGRCEQHLRDNGLDSFVNLARQNFSTVRFFALSSLGLAPEADMLPEPPRPVAVENPLFWILNTLS